MKHISKNIKHRLLYINMLFLCGILSGACNKENEPDITPPSEGEQSNPVEMTFTFDVQTLSPNAAEISITPSDNTQTWYWTRATDKEFTDANKNKDALFKDMLESDIEYGIQEEGFDRAGAVADITHTGPFNNTLQSLFGSTTYHLLAATIDKEGNPLSEVSQYTFESQKTPVSLNTFSIKIPDEDVSYASAKISITPTNQDPYTWFIAVSSQGTPEELADAYIDANGILMNTGLYDIYTGSQIRTINALDPNTSYSVVVFGYQAGRTTSVESASFQTIPAGDPSETVFEFSIDPAKLTARSAEVSVTPSDPSVLYWYELLPAEKYAQYGSNEETVRAYQQQIFTTYEEQGYTIGEIVRGFCARGAVTMSFGPESPAGLLSPETEYIPFAVCMNFDGTLAGEVFVGEKLTTPKATVSSAWAKAWMRAYYDCDQLALLDPELSSLAGKNLLAIDIEISHSSDAAHWYFLGLSADYTDKTKYPEEEMLSAILTNVSTEATLKDETSTLILFPADQQGTFLSMAEDASGNYSEIERVLIGPLSKEGASPIPMSSSMSLSNMQTNIPLTNAYFRTGTNVQTEWPDYIYRLQNTVEPISVR